MLIPSGSHDEYSSTQREAERFVKSALDALSAHVAILDESGRIIGVNSAWQKFAEDNGFRDTTNYGVGMNYIQICDNATRHNSKDAPMVAMGIRDIIAGSLSEFEMEYPCHSPVERRWFVVRVSRFDWYGEPRLIVAHQNVTELKQVQIELAESKKRIEAIMDKNPDILSNVIDRCCAIKAEVVGEDETEKGIRAILNYGHTFGHALEAHSGYSGLSHGYAVALGMRVAARLAVNTGLFSQEEEAQQNRLLDKIGLPSLYNQSWESQDLWNLMGRDKKVESGNRKYILPEKIGSVKIVRNIDKQKVLQAFECIREDKQKK